MKEEQLVLAKKIAEMMNGRQCGDEIVNGTIELAKENNLVIVFGASDDLIEFRGAIDDEADCYEGGSAYITKDGELLDVDYLSDCDHCKYLKKIKESSIEIKALWCETNTNCCWTYEISIPHEKFMIWEDDEQYCQGIIFSLEDIK